MPYIDHLCTLQDESVLDEKTVIHFQIKWTKDFRLAEKHIQEIFNTKFQIGFYVIFIQKSSFWILFHITMSTL
jgi:hypothetical protein